jgi:hypothetical protein
MNQSHGLSWRMGLLIMNEYLYNRSQNYQPIITYGDGWIKKQIGSSSSTIYTKITELDDEWIQEWIKRPY